MSDGNARSRAVALAILVGLIASVGLVIIWPVAELFAAQRDDIEQSVLLLSGYEDEIAARPEIESRYAAMRTTQASLGVLVRGENSDLAAANMQGLMKSLVDQQEGHVRSAQNLPATTHDGLEKVSIQYDLSLPLSHLKETTYKIETGTPYLFLDDVDIQMPESWQSEGAANDPPPLTVRWTVHGYRAANLP